MRANLIDHHIYERRPVCEILAELLMDCGLIADRLGRATELAGAAALAADTRRRASTGLRRTQRTPRVARLAPRRAHDREPRHVARVSASA
jgi:hypothetical protein